MGKRLPLRAPGIAKYRHVILQERAAYEARLVSTPQEALLGC